MSGNIGVFERALAAHRQGALERAGELYMEVLRVQPNHPVALQMLGVVAVQRGQGPAGVELIRRSLAIDPYQAGAHSALGNALRSVRRAGEALESYERALQLDANHVPALSNRGDTLLELGRAQEALESYERVLRLKPDHLSALYSRGAALLQLQRPQDALGCFEQVLRVKPDEGAALAGKGKALRDLGRLEEALQALARCAQLSPQNAQAHHNQGTVLWELRRDEEALESYERALRLDPAYAPSYHGRGSVLLRRERHAEALESYDRALQLDPNNAESYHDRGTVLWRLGRNAESLESLNRAAQLNPNNAETLLSLGNALLRMARPAEAVDHYNRALALDSSRVDTYRLCGKALLQLGRLQEAIANYDRLLELTPQSAEAHFGRGAALSSLGRHEEAVPSFAKAIELDPNSPYAVGSLMQSRLEQCDWQGWAAGVAAVNSAVASNLLASIPLLFLVISDSPQAQLSCAREYARDCCPAVQPAVWSGQRWQHPRIKVAYVSADIREHPVSQLLAGVLEHHDRERFEILALSLWEGDRGAPGRRIEAAVEHFVDVSGQGDVAVAQWINQQQVDLVVDLNGFTLGSRPGIFARRPAPIQATYLGYPGTMGSEYFDYLIADPVVIPAEARQHYTERVVWLPHCYLPFDDRQGIAAETPTRAQAGLPEEGVVFCEFNNPYKINPPLFDIWMRLLRETPGSVLWLRSANARVIGNLRQEALARGVEPARLVFAPSLPSTEEHLARQRLADLFLDTLPYNAHATAINALWVGLPVLTCRGDTFAGRVGASLLEAVGLPELITESLEEYEQRALELARDPQRLAAIRAKLARQKLSAPLFDTAGFCHHLESAYQQMYERHQRGEPPEHLAVCA
jgi:protein O-GlcNAc transferase